MYVCAAVLEMIHTNPEGETAREFFERNATGSQAHREGTLRENDDLLFGRRFRHTFQGPHCLATDEIQTFPSSLCIFAHRCATPLGPAFLPKTGDGEPQLVCQRAPPSSLGCTLQHWIKWGLCCLEQEGVEWGGGQPNILSVVTPPGSAFGNREPGRLAAKS